MESGRRPLEGGTPPAPAAGAGALSGLPRVSEKGGKEGEGEGAWSAAVKRFRDAGGAARSVRGAEAAGRAAEGRGPARFRHGVRSREIWRRGAGV